MKNQIGTSLWLTAFVCGCTSMYPINESIRKKDFFDKINKTAEGRTGQIVQMDGRMISGYNIHVASDSVSWTDSTKVRTQTVPTSDIREMTFKKSARGALEGLVLGIVAGSLLGYIQVEIDPDYYQDVPGIAYISLLGSLGGAAGMLCGGAVGSRDKFVFNDRTLKMTVTQDTKPKEK